MIGESSLCFEQVLRVVDALGGTLTLNGLEGTLATGQPSENRILSVYPKKG